MFTLGFDVAKDKVDGALVNKSGQLKDYYQVPNTVADITNLLQSVQQKHPKLQVGCESTGIHHIATLQACRQLQLPCYVLNPLMTKQYTRSTIRGRKTDPDDARSIARLVLRGEGSLATTEHPFAQTYVRLATKVVQMQQALQLQEQFYQKLHQTLEADATSPFTAAMDELERLSTSLRTQASKLVGQDQLRLLRSIPGVGPVTAVTILAEIGDIKRFPGFKQFIAYTGLDPRVRQSGSSLNRNTKLTKRGSPELRRVLFLAASVARRYDGDLAAYYLKKRDEGRSYTVATIATTRKLCCRIYAVLQRQTEYVKRPSGPTQHLIGVNQG